MRALLDTHTFLWWNSGDEKLSHKAHTIIENEANEIFLSAATAWEISIKFGKGRLQLPEPPETFVAERVRLHTFTPLPISLYHAAAVHSLPAFHHDPFDRLLVAQGQLENLPMLTVNSEIAKYDHEVIW